MKNQNTDATEISGFHPQITEEFKRVLYNPRFFYSENLK